MFLSSYRDVEELLSERDIFVDHVTLWRWVQRYAPELEKRLRKRLKAMNDSWRVGETYVRVKGRWRYLYRAVDASGATLDFLLSAKQDAEAAKRFVSKALGRANHSAPRVIHTDGHGACPPAIERLKAEGVLDKNCRHRVGRYLNNLVEQDHRAINRRAKASPHFRSFWGAWRTLAGDEAIRRLRKGQAFGGPPASGVAPLHALVMSIFGLASWFIPRSRTPLLPTKSCNATSQALRGTGVAIAPTLRERS